MSRVRWAGWSAAAAAALGVFCVGTAWLFMLWDSRTGPGSGWSTLQGAGWAALLFVVVLPTSFLLHDPDRKTFGGRVARTGGALLCLGTPVLAYSWSHVTSDSIMRDRGVVQVAHVAATWRTTGDGAKSLARVRLEDGREFTLEELPSSDPRANPPLKYPAGADVAVTVDPADVVPPRFGRPPAEGGTGIRTAGFAVVALGSLLLAVPLGRRITVWLSGRDRSTEPRDEPRDEPGNEPGNEPRNEPRDERPDGA
ncbi:hypothetical protein [Streptomyces nojiriensis]|uniref:hypothetical protein n=1 Tax=Streptomyces nojiriensis TaxID=66374 RepID=UPI0036BE32A6